MLAGSPGFCKFVLEPEGRLTPKETHYALTANAGVRLGQGGALLVDAAGYAGQSEGIANQLPDAIICLVILSSILIRISIISVYLV